jgi:hypothetical protein
MKLELQNGEIIEEKNSSQSGTEFEKILEEEED